MSNEALIDELSSRLAPVHRRTVARDAVRLAGIGGLELAIFLLSGVTRPDLGHAVQQPFMWWKLGSLALLAAISCCTAVRSFSPTSSPRSGLVAIACLAGLTILAGLALGFADGNTTTLANRLSPMHGLVCAGSIMALSLPVLLMLSILMRSGASAHAEGSALAVGLAAGSWGAFVFAFCCPVNDPYYILLWYSAACAIVALLARLLLPRFAAL